MNQATETAATSFAALGHPTRLRVVDALARTDGGVSAGDLARLLDVPPALLSSHLRILEQAGAISRERQGRTILCHLDRASCSEASDFLIALIGR